MTEEQMKILNGQLKLEELKKDSGVGQRTNSINKKSYKDCRFYKHTNNYFKY